MNTPYYGIAVLALIILMPFLTVAVGDPGIGNHGFPIIFDNAAQARTPHNTGGSSVVPVVTAGPNNETIVVITGAVRCAVTCGTSVPHVTSVTDGVGSVYTDQIDVFNAGNSSDAGHYSLWTGPVPTSTIIGASDSIIVRWNQSTVGYAVAGVYDNVKGIGAVQSISGNSYLANQTITTQFSGSIIVGGSTVMNSSLTNPNVATLTERNPLFNSNCLKLIPPNVFPCVGVDLSDTSPTQYINNYPFLFSQKMNPTGPAKHYPFVQGVIELTSLLTEPNDQTGECTLSPANCRNIGLGVWKNFPALSSCDLSLSNNVSSPICELLGNTTYRGMVIAEQNVAMAGYFAALSIQCITPSNGSGATMTLQYAITDGHSNITNFQTTSGVFIDGLNGCTTPPAFVTSTAVGLNATLANQGYIFRVVGTDGGGPGDNPRFSSINVIVENGVVRNFLPIVTSVTNTAIGVAVYTTFRSAVSIGVTWRWIATNASSTFPGCGAGDVCIQKGTATCTIPANSPNCNTVSTTFPTAFTGTTQAVATDASPGQGASIIAGIDNLLSAQTLTV